MIRASAPHNALAAEYDFGRERMSLSRLVTERRTGALGGPSWRTHRRTGTSLSRSGFMGGARCIIDVESGLGTTGAAQQPRLSRNHRRLDAGADAPPGACLRRAERELGRTLEAAKPRRRGAAVDEARRDCRPVLARIEEHVTESEVDGTRRLQCSRVVAIRKQASTATQRAIDGPGNAHREPLHTQRQSTAVGRFCDEMQVMTLYGEVREPKAEALFPCGEGESHSLEEPSIAQRGETSIDAQRDVQWMVARQRRAAQVRDSGRVPPSEDGLLPCVCHPACEMRTRAVSRVT